jgi:hypothetical protein
MCNRYRLPSAPEAIDCAHRFDRIAREQVPRALDRVLSGTLAAAGVSPDALVCVRNLRVRLRLGGPEPDGGRLAAVWAEAVSRALRHRLTGFLHAAGPDIEIFDDRVAAQRRLLGALARGDATPWWAASLRRAGASTGAGAIVAEWLERVPERALRELAAVARALPEGLMRLIPEAEAERLTHRALEARSVRLDDLHGGREKAAEIESPAPHSQTLTTTEVAALRVAPPAARRLLLLAFIVDRDPAAPVSDAMLRREAALVVGLTLVPRPRAESTEAAGAPAEPPAGFADAVPSTSPATTDARPADLPVRPSPPSADDAVTPAGVGADALPGAEPDGVSTSREALVALPPPPKTSPSTLPRTPGKPASAECGGPTRARRQPQASHRIGCGGLLFLVWPLARTPLVRDHAGDDLRDRLRDIALLALWRAFEPLSEAEQRAAFERERAVVEVFSGLQRDPGDLAPVADQRVRTDSARVARDALDRLVAAIPGDVAAFEPGFRLTYGRRRADGEADATCGRRDADPLARLLLRPGRLEVTPTHADLHLDIAATDLGVRRIGWDIDPGWVPYLGRAIRFHYEKT